MSSGDSDRLDNAVALALLAQLVAGVCSLSAHNAVHHDIKPENITVETGEDGELSPLRLVDLGISQIYTRGDMSAVVCGSPGFFPPELVLADIYDPFKVDV